MNLYQSRKIKFKAWDQESGLLVRLNTIDCNKGELTRKGHVLLQFTGLLDLQENEIYDMDILLLASEKYLVFWNPEYNGWFYRAIEQPEGGQPFLTSTALQMKRLGSYFELERT